MDFNKVPIPESITSEIDTVEFVKMGKKTTVCLITLTTGFEIVGSSACVNPTDFDEEIGEELAYKDALNKLEELDAFLRQARIAELETLIVGKKGR